MEDLINTEIGARRTGKTFRGVLRSLTLASAGYKVIHMSSSRSQSLYAFDWAKDLVRHPKQVAKIISQHSRAIEFENGGRIDFKHPDSNLIGLEYQRAVLDDVPPSRVLNDVIKTVR